MSLVSIGGEGGEEGRKKKRRRRESTFPNDVSMRATLYIYYNCRDFDLEREKEEGNRR